MGFLDKLLGRETPEQQYQHQGYRQQDQRGYGPQQGNAQQGYAAGPQDSTTGATAQDRAAIARYRYLLRTAPPEQIEEAHAQAFGQLSPSQRQQVLQEMTQTLPASERPQSDDPRQMARAATRAEMQQPGYLQRTFGGRGYAGGGMGGGMMGAFGGSMLGTIAGVVIGSAIADTMLGGFEGSPEQQDFAAGGDGSGEATGDLVVTRVVTRVAATLAVPTPAPTRAATTPAAMTPGVTPGSAATSAAGTSAGETSAGSDPPAHPTTDGAPARRS